MQSINKWADNLLIGYGKKQVNISFSCICPAIDLDFRLNIVKVAVGPRGNSQADPLFFMHLFGFWQWISS